MAARQNANPDYSTLIEIKFTAQLPVPTTNRKHRTCKIKCINGEWVGPLCQGKTNVFIDVPIFIVRIGIFGDGLLS